jgi:hypothetical protein
MGSSDGLDNDETKPMSTRMTRPFVVELLERLE